MITGSGIQELESRSQWLIDRLFSFLPSSRSFQTVAPQLDGERLREWGLRSFWLSLRLHGSQTQTWSMVRCLSLLSLAPFFTTVCFHVWIIWFILTAQRRNTTTGRPGVRRTTQRSVLPKRVKSSTTGSTTPPSTITSPVVVFTTNQNPQTATTVQITTTSNSSFANERQGFSSSQSHATTKPTTSKPTLKAVLVMIVEMKANESILDQLEKSSLDINGSSLIRGKTASSSRFTAPPSFRKLSVTSTSSGDEKQIQPFSLTDELTGHESGVRAEFKRANTSALKVQAEKCRLEGGITCKDPRLMCSGFGEIDCRTRDCSSSPTLSCNMDLTKARCSGRGTCSGRKVSPTAEISSSTLSFAETTIVIVAVTLGTVVLIGTAIYAYISWVV